MADSLCSRCGSPLAAGGLAGQCPRCLGALAFGFGETPAEEILHRAGDYEFIRELGRGGMGVVYEARQRSLNRRVAVKMLLAGAWARPEFKPRFRAAAAAAARLRHPGIVTIHEVGEFDGPPLPPPRAARYVRLVAEAIAHAHAAGMLPRDLKPSNVLLDADDQPRAASAVPRAGSPAHTRPADLFKQALSRNEAIARPGGTGHWPVGPGYQPGQESAPRLTSQCDRPRRTRRQVAAEHGLVARAGLLNRYWS